MIRIGIVGAQFAANLHAEAIATTGRATVRAVCSPSEGSRSAFAAQWGANPYRDVEAMLAAEELDALSLAMPNRYHLEATLAAARHGVHVICEKPLALNLGQAREMVAACEAAGVLLLYAEQLCFAPRYERVKQLIDECVLGRIIQIQHWERHGGPHARWFYDAEIAGGGVLLDMGCHGIEVARWLLDKQPVASVHARIGTFTHTADAVDDHALVTLGFADGTIGVIDSSWTAPGGVDERLEVLGTHGSVVADLARGQALHVYSNVGPAYTAEKAASGVGWSYVAHEEARNWGWHGEFDHFVACLEGRAAPRETGADGVEVLEIVSAAYASAASGREIALPYGSADPLPISPWLARG